jgi:diacylglycerol kinase family enzyme
LASDARLELPCDLLQVDAHSRTEAPVELFAVNMVVVGTGPDRQRRWTRTRDLRVDVDGRTVYDGPACAVVVANGQHLRANDLVPRGHPGDGRIETQVYAVAGSERAEMRARLRQGTHLPHPGIRQSAGTVVEVTISGRPAPLEVDGVTVTPATNVRVTVLPGALALLI